MGTSRDPSAEAEADRLLREVERTLEAVRRDVSEVIRHPHPTPGRLHHLHRELRRLRTALSVGREMFPKRDGAKLLALDRRVRRLARLVGGVRDRDVLLELLGSVGTKARPGLEAEMLERHRTRLRDDARTGRELLRAFARSETEAGLLDEVAGTLGRAARTARIPHLGRLLVAHHARGRERVAEAHSKARRRPSMKRLHRLRIRVRQLRQVADLARAVASAPDRTFDAPLHRLQQQLGRLHDLDVLLASLDPALSATGWFRALKDERKRRRREARRALRSSSALSGRP